MDEVESLCHEYRLYYLLTEGDYIDFQGRVRELIYAVIGAERNRCMNIASDYSSRALERNDSVSWSCADAILGLIREGK